MINLSAQIRTQLPPELIDFIQTAGKVAAAKGQRLFLVGGVVRDLLLQRPTLDLDLVAEGDAISLAEEMAQHKQGKIIVHRAFKTARVKWAEWSVDLATARSETYERPGALPKVKPGSIGEDLFRRDFTINAMAVYLEPERYGELIDLFGGRSDLEHKLIRTLHVQSFEDDATRIWRAIRYEQRLDFRIEQMTLMMLKKEVSCLDTITGDRIRHEVELALKEEKPEKVLMRADELGVLAKLHPPLKFDSRLEDKFRQARLLTLPDLSHRSLYLALLVYQLSGEELEKLITYLRLSNLLAKTLRDTLELKAGIQELVQPEIAPSRIYSLLSGCSQTALTANFLISDLPAVRESIRLYLDTLRYIKTALSANDLLKMGIPAGPRIKELLRLLLNARLDGKATSREEEEKLVKKTQNSC